MLVCNATENEAAVSVSFASGKRTRRGGQAVSPPTTPYTDWPGIHPRSNVASFR